MCVHIYRDMYISIHICAVCVSWKAVTQSPVPKAFEAPVCCEILGLCHYEFPINQPDSTLPPCEWLTAPAQWLTATCLPWTRSSWQRIRMWKDRTAPPLVIQSLVEKHQRAMKIVFTFLDLHCALRDPRAKFCILRFTSVIGTQNLEGEERIPSVFCEAEDTGKKTLFAHSSRVLIPRRSEFYFGSWRSLLVSPCFMCPHIVPFVCLCFLPLLPLENKLTVSLLWDSGLSVNYGSLWVFLAEGLDLVRRPLCFVRLCTVTETFLRYYQHRYASITADKRYLLFPTNMLHTEQTLDSWLQPPSHRLHTIFAVSLRRAEVRYTVENQGYSWENIEEVGCAQWIG